MAARVRLQILSRMAGGVVVASIPVGLWWKSAWNERQAVAEDVRTRIRVPGLETSDDRLLEKCQPGDVILFDRRCEKCAAGPWAATACLAQRRFLCDEKRGARTVDTGKFDHIGTYSMYGRLPAVQSLVAASDCSNCGLPTSRWNEYGIALSLTRTRISLSQQQTLININKNTSNYRYHCSGLH
jgi:hypothetical protein